MQNANVRTVECVEESDVKSKAFTLIELLSVIAIVAILAALLFPVFSRAKMKGKETACISNLHQIGIGIGLYMNDNDDVFPNMVDASDKYLPGIWDSQPAWKARIDAMPLISQALSIYVKTPTVFKCPSDNGMDVLEHNFPKELPASPTLYGKYGCSYLLRTELVFSGQNGTSLKDPSNINTLFDATGTWHTGSRALTPGSSGGDFARAVRDYRYNVLYFDQHAKNVNWFRLQDAWSTQL